MIHREMHCVCSHAGGRSLAAAAAASSSRRSIRNTSNIKRCEQVLPRGSTTKKLNLRPSAPALRNLTQPER